MVKKKQPILASKVVRSNENCAVCVGGDVCLDVAAPAVVLL